jgi:TolB-like protein/Tfp pilus assembly protein PilF
MSFLRELQRRKVIRAAAVYLVAAWVLLQVAATIASIVTLPEWFEELVLALLVIGFPIALILAWSLELTPDGLGAESATESSRGNRVVDYSILGVLSVALIWFAIGRLAPEPAPSSSPLDKSVAVLPFTNLSGDEANAAFTSGIHADLLTQLARISSVRTVSRTTVLRFGDSSKSLGEIAKELGVATIVEGGVQRSGDAVHISVQLVDAATDQPLWTQSFDRELTAANIFAIQGEIARAIADQLQAELSPEDSLRLSAIPTENLDALHSYFIGKQMLDERTRESLGLAAEYFEKAVQLDDSFALGWSGLADAYMLLPEYSYSVDRNMTKRRSREALVRALELDPSLPEVRSTEAWFQLTRNYDWQGAEKIFRETLEVFPDNTNLLHWLSHTVAWQGRQEEGVAIARRALEVDPFSRLMQMNLAYILTDAGDFESALQAAWRVRDQEPMYLAQRRNLYLHELRAGEIERGADSFVTYTTVFGGDPDAARAIGDMFVIYARDGTVGSVTDELIAGAQIGTEDLSQVLAFVGDAEGALAALDAAIEERSGSRSALSIGINPAYDFIRDDPRFEVLLKKVGL